MKSEAQLRMESEITNKAMNMMKQKVKEKNEDVGDDVRDYNPFKVLTSKEQMECIENAVEPFLDLLYHYCGKRFVLDGLSKLMTRYRNKR